jgi:group I intron endonuclease
MKGIYKITSPSGRVYIGQSTNIKTRFYNYRKSISCQKQRVLYSSFMKYGIDAHVFEIMHELPKDINADILTQYEQFYIDQFREAGFSLMNLKEAGSHGGHSEETKRKISLGHRGKPKSKEAVAKQSLSMKGRPSYMKGRTHTDEAKLKIKEKRALQTNFRKSKKEKPIKIVNPNGVHPLKGRKLSPESIRKREATRKANGNNKGWSDEARKRRSDLYKGRPSPKKGCKMSPEAIEKMRLSKIGKKASDETRLKMSLAHKKRNSGA